MSRRLRKARDIATRAPARDAIRGDARLFVREGAVEAAWRVVDPVLGNATPVHEYEPNAWGPPEADQIVAKGSG